MEVLVAMVLVSISFGFGVVIYVNIRNSDLRLQKTHAQITAANIAHEIVHDKEFIDASLELDNMRAEVTFVPYKSSKSLQQMTVKVYSLQNNKVLVERKELVLIQ